MRKIVIADDEAIVRQYLSTIIEQDMPGYALCGLAKNGIEALEIIKAFQPELAILDIDMPEMDGIEVLQTLKQTGLAPNTKVLVLSCYNDFEYVKDAMRFGAVDYILKHKVDSKALSEAIKAVFVDSSPVRVIRRAAPTCAHRMPLPPDALLKSLLTASVGPADAAHCAEKLGLLPEKILIAAGRIDYHDKYITHSTDEEICKRNEDVLGLLQTYVASIPHALTACIEEDVYLAVFSFSSETSCAQAMDVARETLTAVCETVQNQFLASITFGTSDPDGAVENFSACYAQAINALKYKLYAGTGRMIEYAQCRLESVLPQQLHNEITAWAHMPIADALSDKQLEQIFVKLAALRLEYAQYQFLLVRMVGAMLGGIADSMLLRSMLDAFDPSMNFLGCETCDDYYAWFSKRIKLLRDNTKEQKYRTEIRQAITYIETHLNEELSLGVISTHVNFSKTYFSQLFKQNTGENLVDFIARLRIAQAKELLVHPDYKVYEIAARVGFENQHYFNRLFKSLVGVTPTEYRFAHCYA